MYFLLGRQMMAIPIQHQGGMGQTRILNAANIKMEPGTHQIIQRSGGGQMVVGNSQVMVG